MFYSSANLLKKECDVSSPLKMPECNSSHQLDFEGDGWTPETKERAYKLFSKYTPGSFWNHWQLWMDKLESGEDSPSVRKMHPRYEDIYFGGSWQQLEKDLDYHFSS